MYIAQSRSIDDSDLYSEDSDRAAHNWAGIIENRSSGNLYLKAFVGGDLTDKIVGPVTDKAYGYSRINTIQVGGAIKQLVWGREMHQIVCGYSIPAARIISASGIDLVKATAGDLDCDIQAAQAETSTEFEITAIDAPAGAVGAEVLPYPNIGRYGDGHVRIGRITAQKAVRAVIDADGGIALIRTTGVVVDGQVTQGGLKGSVSTGTLLPQSLTEGGMFDLAGNNEATITLGELPADASMRVGTYFGVQDTATTPAVLTIGGNAQLKGQVIINAQNDEWPWYRQVVVQRTSGGNLVLGPGSGAEGLYYSSTSAALGGGAVGYVPFHLHGNDCLPPRVDSSPYFDLLQSEFNGDWVDHQRDILLRFYGPVKNDGSGSPVRVFHVISSAVEADVTHRFTVTVNPAGMASARTVQVRGKPEVFHYPGLYRIEPVLSGDDTLYCDVPSKPAVADFSYSFWMLWDCDASGVADRDEIAADETDTLDSDGDGFLDVCTDLGGCLADFDDNGYVNGDDVDLFELLYEAGAIWADVNGDGFTNGTDLDVFGEAFEIGC